TSGMHTEAEWIKSDSAETGSASADTKNIEAVKMNGSEGQERIEKLAGEFGSEKEGDAVGQSKTGVLSPLQEDEGHYYAAAVMKKGKDRLKLATVAWLKEPFRSWLVKAETQVPVTMAALSGSYTLPMIANPSGGCTDDTWTGTSVTNAPSGRDVHTAIWTGSEMIVWGGGNSSGALNTGGRYNPTTDGWTATSTINAPEARDYHTAVWPGSEMIVWGGWNGSSYLNTGGRYNPSTDSWTATSLTNAPVGRTQHTAVWTGSQMIVWGGVNTGGYLNTGGRYSARTAMLAATSTICAADGRVVDQALYTGSHIGAWGGALAGDVQI